MELLSPYVLTMIKKSFESLSLFNTKNLNSVIGPNPLTQETFTLDKIFSLDSESRLDESSDSMNPQLDEQTQPNRKSMAEEKHVCGKWSWSSWSPCSGSCNTGEEKHTRTRVKEYVSGVDKEKCEKDKEIEECGNIPCPGKLSTYCTPDRSFSLVVLTNQQQANSAC